jgi:NAD(P)-dependent dehydrogenase (short-subunit alcohol dehydrogenase family)
MRTSIRPTKSVVALAGIWAGAMLVARAIRARRAMSLAGRVALVTGGSRGLGLLIARELGRQGAQVTIAARDEDELRRAQESLRSQGVEAAVVAADVANEADATRIVNDVIASHGQLDVLVNNAGVIKVGPFEHMTTVDFEEAMNVHLWGPLHTMRTAIPHMRARGGGRIVNISSIGGKIGVPHLVPYCASKFALTGLSTSLQAELSRHRVYVTTVSPGLMRTGSPFNAWFKGRHREEFAWFAIADSLPVISIGAQRAAAQVVDALRHGDAELVISWPAKLAIAAAATMRNTFASLMATTNQFLPSEIPDAANDSHSGWQSGSTWAPSRLTRLSERSAAQNNELPSPTATAEGQRETDHYRDNA